MNPSHSSKRSNGSFFCNFCRYFKIWHRDSRKYCSSPTDLHVVSMIYKVFYSKIWTFVRAFCWLNFMSNLHGFNKVIVFSYTLHIAWKELLNVSPKSCRTSRLIESVQSPSPVSKWYKHKTSGSHSPFRMPLLPPLLSNLTLIIKQNNLTPCFFQSLSFSIKLL